MTKANDIVEYPDMAIVMPDGCRLSARVWMPANALESPVPAILEFLPYRKRDGTTARDCLTHPYFAKNGYACIRVDMRGNGDSQGIMEVNIPIKNCAMLRQLSPGSHSNLGALAASA